MQKIRRAVMQEIRAFELPDATLHVGRNLNCAICGAQPNPEAPEDEHISPNGRSSYSPDADLCLECAIHLWRAFKAAHPNYGQAARDLLRGYRETQQHVPSEDELTRMPPGMAEWLRSFRTE
jgi:hypothetical protein